MRFIADTMLGTLAKWLRIMGHDVIYVKDLDDGEIIRLASREGRIIISRDRELCGRVPGSILIESKELRKQLIQVLRLHPVDPVKILTRCLECNSALISAKKESIREIVPEAVFSRTEEFWQCPGCKKVYWRGSHYDKMTEEAKEILSQCES